MVHRDSHLTKEQLLKLEEEWLSKEEESPQTIEEGICLYRRLSRINPECMRYRESLAKLLLKKGTYEKIQKRSFDRAKQTFCILIKLAEKNKDNHPLAHYRLGFLYFYDEEWTKAIDSFQKALSFKTTRRGQMLTKEQRVKAHHYILKATQIIALDTLEKINNMPEEDLDLFEEIKLLKREMENGLTEEKPYLMIVNGTETRYISEWEYEVLSTPNHSCVILDQGRAGRTILSILGNEGHISETYVPLLELLMKHPEGIKNESILLRLYDQRKNSMTILRQNIRRLRERIERISPIHEQFIETIEQGYRWNTTYEYLIFKHTRDVSHDFLAN